jgi:nitronate monooxygenase
MSALQSLFNIEFPLIQAPMAGVQGWELATAVSAAGALGSIPCAMLTPDDVRDAVTRFRARTDRPVNLNFFCHQSPEPDAEGQQRWLELFLPWYTELGLEAPKAPVGPGRLPFNQAMADRVSELAPEVVSFHFGLPEPSLLEQIRAGGARIISSATTVEEACWLEQNGVDAIIAQGLEAGGHRGMFLSEEISTQVGTFALLPQIRAAVKVPVVAAGGIADAVGVQAALALGADGVQVGTAYLLCPEAHTSPVHRRALTSEKAGHTLLTNLFSGRPARGMVNRMIHELGAIHPHAPRFPLATAASAPLRATAESKGLDDFTPLWAGQNVTGCRAIPAAELTQALVSRIKCSGKDS